MKKSNRLIVAFLLLSATLFFIINIFEASISYFFLAIIPLIVGVLIDYNKIKAKEQEEEVEYEKLQESEHQKLIEQKEKQLLSVKQENDRKIYLDASLKKYHTLRKSIISKHDSNKDGEIDLIPDHDFNKLLKKHQSKIVEIDKTYIQKFVKISNFINFKKKTIPELYTQLLLLQKIDAKDISEESWRMRTPSLSHFERLNDIDELIQMEIHTYESVIFHSISMVTALLNNDLLTFYEIFESFDKLGIFNTNWENELTEKLSNIEDKLDDLIDSIEKLENRITNSLDSLSYTTESSFKELNKSVSGELSEIGSSLKFNNLLTGIQVYQTHKLNKNMKRLN